jgi:hypothetical protein
MNKNIDLVKLIMLISIVLQCDLIKVFTISC